MKHYVAADLHMDMARILIREIEAYLAKVAAFETYLVTRVRFAEHQDGRVAKLSNISDD